ncbi:peptidoglycan-binding domain-containing protein [Oricola cellulosilytica]|uniref:Peptidoglycan binding-like domain-containing protein n=1 Tax=Oricola cellulosilytica TaxID=1429082 RepID=A0A4R0PA21_9HYPH|nr:peptidoglycan-binding protein [Oricola cellulosilytica]TCD14102.1 hypothetical protein E0D97_08385 [Oricola cellulosilytica]
MRFDSQDDRLTVSSALGATASFVGERLAANPAAAGGVTAFAVAMAFFGSNALFFQEAAHPSAIFETRPASEAVRIASRPPEDAGAVPGSKAAQPNVTRFVIEPEVSGRTSAAASPPAAVPVPQPRSTVVVRAGAPRNTVAEGGDADVAGIQELLAKLGYYDGAVDGLKGPMTNSAIEAYKKNAGLRGIELTDTELRTSMLNNMDVTAAIPEARPGTDESAGHLHEAATTVASLLAGEGEAMSQPLPSQIPSAEVVKIQAALRAFGNSDVVVDGVAGAQTEQAIREFQALFRLPVTGSVDDGLLDKMRTVGLIQ